MQDALNEQTGQMDPLAPPPSLDSAQKWIVRLRGVDMGPFSSQDLYTKLLTGEIEPESMLLDEERFTRCRLREVPEFSQYLHLHNTHNPILLEEQRQQEREEYWQTTGKKRVILSVSMVLVLLIGGFVSYRVFFYKSQDVYMSDGDFLFASQPFQASKQKKKVKRDWTYRVRRRRSGRKNKAKGKKQGPAATSVDFTSGGGGDGIPRAKINASIRRNIRGVFSCFKRQIERDGNFTGGEIVFKISGRSGSVASVRMESGGSRILTKCIRRKAKRWSMPTFNGNAVIHYPVYVRRRSRW